MAHPEGIIWPGLAFKDRRWTVTPVGCDLYFGLPGIALFLAQEGTLLRHDASLTLASRAIDSIVTALKRSGSSLGAVGAFSGWAGLLYCFAQVRHALNRGDLDGECEAILDRLPDCLARDQFFDIVGGAAGCLAVLLHLRTVLDESRCMELAVACADHLLQSAEASDDGLSWRSSPSNVALTGFGHGASGIAWALCRMFDATGDQRYLDAAVRAARFERQHYSDEFRNWTDLRPMDGTFVDRVDGSRYLTAWCHGAMGIGLARHELLRHTDDPHVRAEFDAAIATTWHNGFGRDDCLCHGSLGNLELFWAAAATSSLDPAYDVSALTTRIYRNLKRRGPFCSTPCAVDTPGLMVGLAGIGYQLLRLVNPMRVPSVLLLDGPCAAAGETAAHGHGAA
jgi:type 2 lantibiotic biosynthesis protein LanM